MEKVGHTFIRTQNYLSAYQPEQTRKGKAAPVHAMQAYRRSGGIAPVVLNVGTGWT